MGLLELLLVDLKALTLFQGCLSDMRHLFTPTGRNLVSPPVLDAQGIPQVYSASQRQPPFDSTIRGTKQQCLTKAKPPSFPPHLLGWSTTTSLQSLFCDALNPNWKPTRGSYKPWKGYHLYDEYTLSIREKLRRRDIQIFDDHWIDITGEVPMFKADTITIYFRKYLKWWRPRTPYEKEWEDLQYRKEIEEW